MKCININAVLFQTLKKRSGLTDFDLQALSRYFLENYDRWPNLDELPSVNSSASLMEDLHIKDNSTNILTILDFTGKDSILESVVYINNEFRDLETEILPLKTLAVVSIKLRPSKYRTDDSIKEDIPNYVNMRIVISNLLLKLADLYGINIIPLSKSDINSGEFNSLNASQAKGFIYNGNIYLNVDNVTLDTLIHELMHIFVGSMRFQNPQLYENLLDSISLSSNTADIYPNRTEHDIREEVFVSEYAKYITGQDSIFNNISKQIQYELDYNIKRTLDSFLMGTTSAFSQTNIPFKSLRLLTKDTNSSIMSLAYTHRVLNNLKSELLESGELIEQC